MLDPHAPSLQGHVIYSQKFNTYLLAYEGMNNIKYQGFINIIV